MSTGNREQALTEVVLNPVRRRVLRTLTEQEPPIHVQEVAAGITESPEGFDDSIVALLHHVHVPKLADIGLVEYDSTENLITDVMADAQLALEAYETWSEIYQQKEKNDSGVTAANETSPSHLTSSTHTTPHPDPDTTAQPMTVIVDIDLPADQFVLGDVVSQDESIQIELERIVPLDDAILPFLWVSDGSNDAIERLLRSSAYVTGVTRLVTLEDKALYQLEWTQDVNGVIGALEAAEGVIMEGHGTNTSWSLRLRFTSHERFKEFAERCRDLGIDLTLRAVYNPHPPVATGMLTTAQREALRIAAEWGYFKVPREVTLRELSEHFGVSEQAVSQRLRRGLDNLVAGSLDL